MKIDGFYFKFRILPDNLPAAYFQGSAPSTEITEQSLSKLSMMESSEALFERKTEDEVISISTVDDEVEEEYDYYESEDDTDGVYSKEWGFFVKNGFYKDGVLYDNNGYYDPEGYYHPLDKVPERPQIEAVEIENKTPEKVETQNLNLEPPQAAETYNSGNYPLYPPCYYKFTSSDQIRELALMHARRHHQLFGYPTK